MAKGSETNFIYINIIRPRAITKWTRFNALFVKNVFRNNKILGSIMMISNKTLKGSLVTYVVKSLGKSARWDFILKSNTLIVTCPFRNGVVRYARNHIPIQEPKKETWSGFIKQNQTIFFILCEIMYKTKYTLARHTNSEEYLKVKTKFKLKI